MLGFGTSFLPSVLKFFQAKEDNKQELRVMAAQLEQQKVLGDQRLQMVNVQADIAETDALLKHDKQITSKAGWFIISLAASVRPMIAYMLFIEFFLLTYLLAAGWITKDLYMAVWNEPTQMTFAAVVSFYFGSRSFNRKGHS
mgnify:FL=1